MRRAKNLIPQPIIVVVLSLGVLASVAVAGSLIPSGPVGSTMHSLAQVYDYITGTFDSSGVTANQNGSLIENLKYIEQNLAWASDSNDIWNLNSGNVGIGTVSPNATLDVAGSALFSGSASVSQNFDVGGTLSALKFLGSGLTSCSGISSKLLYDSALREFFCSTDAGSSGAASLIDVGEAGLTENPTSSVSFNASHFSVSFSSPLAIIGLDWGAGGPASLSQDETVSGAWTFSNAVNFNTSSFSGQASFNGLAQFNSNASVSGIVEAGMFKGDAQSLTLKALPGSTYSTVQDLQNIFHSSGWVSGGAINDLGGNTVSVDAGSGLIRSANSATAPVYYFDWPASNSLQVQINEERYIGIDYNGGNPKVVAHTSADWNNKTNFPLGRVANEEGLIHISMDQFAVGDHAANMIQRDYETMPLAVDMRNGGLMLEESGDGNRYVMMSSGALWDRLNRFSIPAFDSGSGGTFDRYYRDGSGGFVKESAQVQWPNGVYDDGSGSLATLSPGKYAVLWLYIETDGAMTMVYGRGQYTDAQQAQQESVPATLPARLTAHGRLAGRIIFQKNASVATAVQSAFEQGFNPFFSTALLTTGLPGESFFSVSSLSFEPGAFNLNFNGTSASLSLDWANGPASRSIAQTITAPWTFAAGASASGNLQITGAFRGSSLLISGVASVSSTLEATALKAGLLGSDAGLTISPALGLTNMTGSASVSANFESAGYASASGIFGAGLGSCVNSGSKLLWSDGVFSCGIDQVGSGAEMGLRVTGDNFTNVTSVSFDAAHFVVALPVPDSVISLNWGAGGPASLSQNEIVTGNWRFSNNVSASQNLEVSGYSSTSSLFGAGLSSCNGVAQKLLWSNGKFVCGADAGASGGAVIDVIETGGAEYTVGSVSFNGAHFNAAFSSPQAIISLDWGAGGPASLSASQIVTGFWQFNNNASASQNLEVLGYASASRVFGAGLTTCSGLYSVLKYDASTGRFDCGVEAGGVRTEQGGASVLVNNTSLNFAASAFSVAASGSSETNIGVNWTTGPASRSIAQSITGAWTFSAANTALIVSTNASVSGTMESLALKADTLSSSTGTLTIGAYTLGGLLTANNQTITGVGQLNFTNASGSSALESALLKASTIGSDAGLTISPSGQLTFSPGTRTQINGAASVSSAFEVASYASASQLFGAGLTDCDSEGQRLVWTASGSNRGKFGCKSGSITSSYMAGFQDAAAASVNVAGIFTTTGNTAFSVNTGISAVRMNTAGYVSSCMIIGNANVTAGQMTVVFQKNDSTVTGNTNQWCRLTTSINRTNSEAIPAGAISFVAGDTIGVAASTSTGFTPTNGDYTINFTVTFPTGADIAETYFTQDEELKEGMVAALDGSMFAGVRRASGSAESVIGVISTTAGLVIGESAGPGRKVNVALAGRVPVWVSSENGPIQAGDLLSPSTTVPGAAAKAIGPGYIIGQALVDYDGDGVGQTIMFVKNGWYNGSQMQSLAPEPSFVDAIIAAFKNMIITVKEIFADKVTTKQLCLDDICVNRDQLKDLLDKNHVDSAQSSDIPVASPAESVTPSPFDTPVIETSMPAPTESPVTSIAPTPEESPVITPDPAVTP